MIYQFDKELHEISPEQIQEDKLTAGYLKAETLETLYEVFGMSQQDMNQCIMDTVNYRSSIDSHEDSYFGIVNVIDINDIYGSRDRIGFYIKKNLFLVIDIQDVDNSTKECFLYAVQKLKPEQLSLEKMVYGFFERLLSTDNKELDQKETAIEELEEDIHKGTSDREYIKDILALKKEVGILRNYYEQLIFINETLEENETGLFLPEELANFKMLTGKLERLSNHCLILKENLVQVREAYSASLDYSINAVMKLFTVVTTIFQPLTLITGWYGMNFTNMPELTWRYGYITVIILSFVVVLFCFWLFKKKRLL